MMNRPVDPERARRRRRRLLVLVSLPVVALVLFIAARLVLPAATTADAISLYDSGRYTESEDRSTELLEGNLLEPWIPWFNRGDARIGDEDYTGAIDDFEKALELAPPDRTCEVRVNLALSWSTLGDIYEEAGFHQGAVQLYDAAEKVIADGADQCRPPDPAAEELGRMQADLENKKAEAEARRDREDADNPTGPGDLDDKLDDLGDKQSQSDEEKANEDSRDRGESDPLSGLTGKPW
jgi:tetratricopeptide (TPR) repeat protein